MAAAQKTARMADSVKDAAIAAFLVAVLGFFFFALRTDIGTGGLNLTYRWGLWLTAIAITFGVRLALNLLVFKAARPLTSGIKITVPVDLTTFVGRFLGPVLLIVALCLPFILMALFPNRDRQFIDLAILIMTYVMLGWGLNIVVGLAGLLDLGYVAFYAVGAYSFALLAQYFEIGFWTALPLAGLLAAFWGIILGYPVLRLRGDYLAIVTLAFRRDHPRGAAQLVRVYRRPGRGSPEFQSQASSALSFPGTVCFADFFGLDYDTIHRFIYLYYIILVLALITNFVTLRLRKLPIGRAWEALREDEIACRSLGINTHQHQAHRIFDRGDVRRLCRLLPSPRVRGSSRPKASPSWNRRSFLAIVVLGGLGSQVGVVIASVVMIGGIEVLRNLGFLKGNLRPGFRAHPVPHADFWPRHGADHGLEAARHHLEPQPFGGLQGTQEDQLRHGRSR